MVKPMMNILLLQFINPQSPSAHWKSIYAWKAEKCIILVQAWEKLIIDKWKSRKTHFVEGEIW